jgi:hypothetical protein
VKDIAAVSRVKVSADGRGVVSHAGMGLLRELADLTGLSAQVMAVLTDTYRGPWVHAPGEPADAGLDRIPDSVKIILGKVRPLSGHLAEAHRRY